MRLRLGGFERRKDELAEEIRAHLAMDVADRVARGESLARAEAEARREFGNVGLVRDVTQGMWGWEGLERLVNNLRYALRVLRRSPGFSLTVMLTLAVGVGSTSAMFTVVDRVLLRSLPYRAAGELTMIRESGKRAVRVYGSPYLDIDDWRQRSKSFSEIGFFNENTKRVGFIEGRQGTSHVSQAEVSANLFELLGAHVAMGRGFLQRDAGGSVKAEDAKSILLSDAAWRTEFGADAAIVGKVVELNGKPLTVIGVMPRGFDFPYQNGLPVVWTPVVLGAADAERVHNVSPNYETVARLRPGVTLAEAQVEMSAIQKKVAMSYAADEDREDVATVQLVRYSDSLVDDQMRKALLALFGASALLWLIACVNVTSLLLARATGRQREIAVRGALGASRRQIVEQLLLEGLMLSGGGSLLGLGLAAGMLKVFAHGLKAQFDLHERLTPNLAVLGGLLVLTMASGLLTSVWPALGAARASIEGALRAGGPQQGMGRAQHRTRAVLVMTEIALSLTLLVGCGLLLRTIYALKHVALGFHTDHVLVANMAIPAYKFDGKNMTTELFEPLVERAKRLPGVESATLLTEVPLGKTFNMIFTFSRESKSADDVRRANMLTQFRVVGPEMQRVFGFKMLRGRFFNAGDTATSRAVVVVNTAFVREYYGDERDSGAILGQELMGISEKRRAVVVGVLDDERQVSVAEPSMPELEVCLPQITPDSFLYKSSEGRAMDLAVRTSGDPATVMNELRGVMRAASPDLGASNFSTMDQVVEDSFGSQNLAAELLEIFGGSALLLCLAGIYGLLAYLVAQRQREMGLRLALGAQRWHVMGLVMRQASWMLGIGLAAGLGLAYLASAGLKTFLYGVRADDPWTMAGVTAVLFLGGIAAAWIPARRAARVDPMQALRAE